MTVGIKHNFQSAIADDGDPTLLSPNKWNDYHVIDDGGIPVVKIAGLAAVATSGSASDLGAGTLAAARLAANTIVAAKFAASTTQVVLGRNTAGAGGGEEVTASQLFDWVSNTNGALLTRTGGAWAAIANVSTDSGDLVFAANPTPVAPAAGVKLFSRDVATRPMLAQIGPAGSESLVQPHLGRAKTGLWMPISTGIQAIGILAPSLTGTGTQRAPGSTNLLTSMRRIGIVSAAGAGSLSVAISSGVVGQFWRGNAVGLGGYTAIFRFAVSDAAIVATANMLVGLTATNIATDVDPSTRVNILGIGCTSGDTVLQLYAAGSAAQARVSLGANFPVNNPNVDVYELALYAPPNGSSVGYLVTRLNTGDKASGVISAAANLPSATTFMSPVFSRSNGGTASAVGIDVCSLSVETDF